MLLSRRDPVARGAACVPRACVRDPRPPAPAANFLLTGALVVAGALGLRVVSRGSLGPALHSVYGLGLIAAGAFPADPPGAAEATTRGVLHFAGGGIGFLALAGACFWFAREGGRGWRWFSALAAAGLLAGFDAVGAAPLALYAAVAVTWAWHFALHARVLMAPPWTAASAARLPQSSSATCCAESS